MRHLDLRDEAVSPTTLAEDCGSCDSGRLLDYWDSCAWAEEVDVVLSFFDDQAREQEAPTAT